MNKGKDYKQKITVLTQKLDVMCKGLYESRTNICLKIDTEGSELRVLKGAEKILEKCKVVVAEGTFYPTLNGANNIFELINFMESKSFKIIDLVNIRKSRENIDQCDVIFERKNLT